MGNRFTIHGTRGTMPVAGRRFEGHGTQTTCFSLRTPRGLIVVDAGTGIIALSDRLRREAELPPITLLFTHFHLDHVIGLPLFQPLYRRRARITIMADPARPGRWKRSLAALVGPPFWPVGLGNGGARVRLEDLPAGGALRRHGVRIAWRRLRHPQQCLAYRLETGGRALVIATDHEPGDPGADRRLLRFCRGADVLVVDAQYTPGEKEKRRGWGHGAWPEAAALARDAGVGELILTHHDRGRTDAQLEAIVRQACRLFPRTRAARDGMTVAF